jgi:AcrR family transcriptional regulator
MREPTVPNRRTRHDPRREQTPKRLVAAARIVFERDGFYNARLADVSVEADVAAGTLYNYYRSKHELFRAVFQDVAHELTAITPGHVGGQRDPVRRLEEVNRGYVRAFRSNARMMSLLYQAAETDAEIRALGEAVQQHLQGRAEAAIARWQQAGLVYADLDPVYTAHALTFMVERVSMAWVAGRVDYDEDVMVETINQIWVRALGLVDEARESS